MVDIEPKNLKTQEIYRLLDLAATEDDQHEVSQQIIFPPLHVHFKEVNFYLLPSRI